LVLNTTADPSTTFCSFNGSRTIGFFSAPGVVGFSIFGEAGASTEHVASQRAGNLIID